MSRHLGLVCLIGFAILAALRWYNNQLAESQDATNVTIAKTETFPLPAPTKEETTASPKSSQRKARTSTSSSPAPAPLMAAAISQELILKREGYTVSYNTSTRQPNYVAWTLTPQRIKGSNKRSGTFFEDPELANDQRSTLDDYRSSGFDRGHLCPAGDNKWSATAMIESFYLSNICPQKHSLNNGDWKELEEACREWTVSLNAPLYIVAGPLFPTLGSVRKLHKRVAVPDRFFKAIVCLDTPRPMGIAFLYPNTTVDRPMSSYAISIDSLESLSGYDFYATLSKSLQKQIEKQNNLEEW